MCDIPSIIFLTILKSLGERPFSDSLLGSFDPVCELYFLICEQAGSNENGVLAEYLPLFCGWPGVCDTVVFIKFTGFNIRIVIECKPAVVP